MLDLDTEQNISKGDISESILSFDMKNYMAVIFVWNEFYIWSISM